MGQVRRGTVVGTALVLAALVAPPVEGRRVVRLAVIAPADRDHEQSLYRVLPAVQLAVRKVADPIAGTLPGWDIRVDHRDSRCSSTFGPLAAFDFYINRSAGTAAGRVPIFKARVQFASPGNGDAPRRSIAFVLLRAGSKCVGWKGTQSSPL
jgi:hypothetical protein